jgi:hypothetical protein
MASNKPYIFEEGNRYNFTITGTVLLPPDDEKFLILQSSHGSKHLLKYEPYKDYGLQIGNRVDCRIDKISCSGKIYLEPEHKSYKEGTIYCFKISGFEEILNSEGMAEKFLGLFDVNGQVVFVNIGDHSMRDFAETVLCRVDRIKKGKLYLSLADSINKTSKLETGKDYEFLITGLVTLAEDEEFYTLQDEFDEIHYLRTKYFKDYGLHPGDKINCKVITQPQIFRHYLEPEHPYYKVGAVYRFFVSGNDSYENEFGEKVIKILVKDGEDKEYFADCGDVIEKLPDPGSVLDCRVESIRMSKLILTCV